MQKGKSLARQEKKMGIVKKIYILHGWTYTTEKWGNFIKQLEDRGFKTNLLKIPGLTQNSKKVWNVEEYVDWLKAKVRQKGQIILMGHSNGGRIAIAFAAKHPQKLSKLILVDSGGIYHNELPLRIKRTIFKSLAKVGKMIFPSGHARTILYKIIGESDYKSASPLQRQIMINMISDNLTSHLKNITTPTLIIWGLKDNITHLSDGKLMNKLIKDSKLKIISGAGHCPQYTHPKEVAKIICEYL